MLRVAASAIRTGRMATVQAVAQSSRAFLHTQQKLAKQKAPDHVRRALKGKAKMMKKVKAKAAAAHANTIPAQGQGNGKDMKYMAGNNSAQSRRQRPPVTTLPGNSASALFPGQRGISPQSALTAEPAGAATSVLTSAAEGEVDALVPSQDACGSSQPLMPLGEVAFRRVLQENRDEFLFMSLGGCGEIGMNSYLYHQQGRWLAVDLGIIFVQQRLETVLALPDPSVLEVLQESLDGLVITHGHEDHIGAIVHLWPLFRCPIYCTPFTAALLQPRLEDAGLDEVVEVNIIAAGQRVQTGPFDFHLQHVTHSIPDSTAMVLQTPHGQLYHSGDWRFDHEPMLGPPTDMDALRALGDKGILAVVGDSTNANREGWGRTEREVMDGLRPIVAEACRTAGKVVAVCFSTHVERVQTLTRLAREAGRQPVVLGRGMVNVTSLAADIGLYSKDVAAAEEGQGMVAAAEAATAVEAAGGAEPPAASQADLERPCADLDDKEPVPMAVAHPGEVPPPAEPRLSWLSTSLPPEKCLFIATGCQGEEFAALSRMARGNHPSVKLSEGDVVIFSSRPIPGNEEAINHTIRRLRKRGVRIIEDGDDGAVTHASGHPFRKEIRQQLEMLRPSVLLAVHGEDVHQRAHADLALECGVKASAGPRNGELYRLRPGELTLVAQPGATPWLFRERMMSRDRAITMQPSSWTSTSLQADACSPATEGHCFVTLQVSADGRWHSEATHTLTGYRGKLSAEQHVHLRHLLGVSLAHALEGEVSMVEAKAAKAAAEAAAAEDGDAAAAEPAVDENGAVLGSPALDLRALTPLLRRAVELALMQVLSPAPAVTLHLLQRL
jgi:ribonuclease J